MHDTTQDKIGLRELIAIILLTVAPKIIDGTPVHFYTVLGNSAWMAPIFAALFASIPIYLLYKVISAYDDKNLLDVIEILFGKYIGWFIIFILWINLSIILVHETGMNVDLVATMYYPDNSVFILYFSMLFVISFGVIKGIQAIGSSAWIFIFILKFILFLSLTIAMFSGATAFLFPFFGNGEWEVIKTGFKNTAMYSEFLYFFILITMLKKRKEFKTAVTSSFFIILFDITFAMITFLMLFDFEAITKLSYPYHELIRYISLGFITNVEILFFPFFMLTILIRFSVYLYLNMKLFGKLFNIKKPEMIAPIFAAIIGFIGLIPESGSFSLTQLKMTLTNYFSIILISLPILMMIVFKLKGGKKTC